MQVPTSGSKAVTDRLGGPKPGPDVLPIPRSAADFDDLRDPTACTVRYSHPGREPGLRVYPNLGALDEQVVAALLGLRTGALAPRFGQRSVLSSNSPVMSCLRTSVSSSLFVPFPSLPVMWSWPSAIQSQPTRSRGPNCSLRRCVESARLSGTN